MRVLIIGGFLGSGKTTIILKLASLIVSKGLKAAILVNEIGEIGVDGETLQTSGVGTRELTNGCICCTLKYSLHDSIKEIEETYHPDILLIEPTGIALPRQIRDEISEANVMMDFAPIVTVADASRLHAIKGQVPAFMSVQIEEADLIAINKTDAVSSELVSRVEETLRKTNPDAFMLRMSAKANDDDISMLYDIVLEKSACSDARTNEKNELVKTARSHINSVEFSNVSSASVSYKVKGKLLPKRTGSLLSDMIGMIAKYVAELNEDFVGHIKTSLPAGDCLVRVSQTSSDETTREIEYLPRENETEAAHKHDCECKHEHEENSHEENENSHENETTFICMAAVTNVPKDKLQKIVECASELFLAVSGLTYETARKHHHHHCHCHDRHDHDCGCDCDDDCCDEECCCDDDCCDEECCCDDDCCDEECCCDDEK